MHDGRNIFGKEKVNLITANNLNKNSFMENQIYHIKIKKEYASALIEDLQQVDAIEILELQVPDWQKKETLKRLADMKTNPSSAISEDEFLKALNGEDE